MNGTPHDFAVLAPAEREGLEDTLSAYALGALPDAEAAAVVRHLATCPDCRALALELRATVDLLPLVCEPAAPSPALKGRVLEAVEDARRAGPVSLVAPLPAAPSFPTAPAAPTPITWAGARPPRRLSLWAVLPTAALLLISVGLGLWNFQLQQEVRSQSAIAALYEASRQSWTLSPTREAPGARGVLIEPAAGGQPVLLVHGLPTPPADRSYQVWLIRDGQPVSVGLLRAGSEGQQSLQLQQALSGAQAAAISIEPAGGSPSPTGPIIMAAQL
jgi:anti-sigma-K factor RskA